MLKPVTVKSWGIWAICALAAVVVAGCGRSVQNPVNHNITIGNIVSLQSEFGPEFTVKTMKPAGMNPKLLSPAPLPRGDGRSTGVPSTAAAVRCPRNSRATWRR